MTTIETLPVTGTELHLQYPGQTSPQDVHVCLDAETGRLWAAASGEIGNGVPVRVYHGHVQRWSIPALKGDAANALLEEIEPLAARVCDGYWSRWDGSNHVAAFDDDASEAIEEIQALCEQAEAAKDEHTTVNVWAAADWLGGIGNAAAQASTLGITAATTDDELAAIETRVEGEADGEGVDSLTGLRRHLEWLRSEAIDAAD
ncbi:MAG: hypothetical protein Q8S73_12605 [Deltaproteobacteria bacterium]|nr:hypothetical protein [Myxococcales bacterium]MDP3214940.1 hypothetical protein [Deltaproteobacteria bacterium]